MVMADPWFTAATDAEAWAMLKVMAASWRQIPAGSLPNNDSYIWEITRIRDRKGMVKAAIRKQWQLSSDNRLYHPHVTKMVMESLTKGKHRRPKNGAGGRAGDPYITRQDTTEITEQDQDIPF
jgi:hypothetical protein